MALREWRTRRQIRFLVVFQLGFGDCDPIPKMSVKLVPNHAGDALFVTLDAEPSVAHVVGTLFLCHNEGRADVYVYGGIMERG